jgi:hypothetical protein
MKPLASLDHVLKFKKTELDRRNSNFKCELLTITILRVFFGITKMFCPGQPHFCKILGDFYREIYSLKVKNCNKIRVFTIGKDLGFLI